MNFLRSLVCIVLLCLAQPANAFWHGIAAPGSAQVGLTTPQFLNAFASTGGLGAPVDASNNLLVDVNGMPNGTFTGNVGITPNLDASIVGNSTQWELLWTNCTFKYTINIPVNFVSSVGSPTISGGSNSNMTITTTATTGNVVFTFFNFGGGNVSSFFPSGFANSCSGGNLALMRVSDLTAYNAGSLLPIPENVSIIKNLNPSTVRVMGWTPASQGSEVQWAYRATTSTLSWVGDRWVPSAWGGTISGTDAYTMNPATDTPLSGWVGGEVIQGVLTNAPTSITVTNVANNGSGLCRVTVNSTATLSTNQKVLISAINGASACNSNPPTFSTITLIGAGCSNLCFDIQGSTFSGAYTSGGIVGSQSLAITGKTGGAKLIANNTGSAIGSNFQASPTAGAKVTMVYDAVLDEVLLFVGGISTEIPVEAQVSFANTISANLWTNLGPMANDGYATNWSSYICGHLNNYFYPEYGNELWNTNNTGTLWLGLRGIAFGFPSASSRNYYSTYGLRVRQIMGTLIPSACSGHMANVRRTLMVQEFGNTSNFQTYALNGSDLAPNGTSTGIGNSVYNTATGSANYTANPNRPIDVVETMGYANYVGGTNLCTGPDVNCNPTSINASFYQTLVTNYESGGAGITAAIAAVDNDIRQGLAASQTVTASGTTFTTPLAHGFTAGSTNVAFNVTGGTSYSGLVSGQLYQIDTTPTGSTFTVRAYSAGSPAGSDINAGLAGSGTVSVGISNVVNMLNSANTKYQLWETVAASYDGARPAGMAALRMENYEGALEPQGLSAGQCTSLGISGTNCTGSIAAAITAWKNDPSSATTVQAYFNQWMGRDAAMVPTFGNLPHSKEPAWLQIVGPNVWSLLPGGIFSTPYQTYNGFAGFRL